MLFRPELQPVQAHRMTMLCSMAAADALEGITELSVDLKWPNDLVTRSVMDTGQSRGWLKLAGILTEAELSGGELAFVVVGLGININVPRAALPSLAPNATSVLAETGQRTDRSELLVRLLDLVEQRYRRLQRGENPHEEWSERLTTLGKRLEVATDEGVIEGTAEGVDENGALILRTPGGSVRRLLAGDVTVART